MNISSMLSGGTADRRDQQQPPQASVSGENPQTASSPGSSATLQAGGQAGYGPSYNRPVPFHTPGQPGNSGRPPYNATSPGALSAGPMPYPGAQQTSASPIATLVGGGRPVSGGHHFAPPPPLHRHSGSIHSHGAPSHSPTPSSQPSQTPHSTRQSPSSIISQPFPAPNPQHVSQPVTPIGPSQLQHQKAGPYSDLQSPSLYRSTSMISAGIPPISPINHHQSSNHNLGSPESYPAPSQVRYPGDTPARAERERSVSVSPKSQVPLRPPSLGSRHSSMHDTHSVRSTSQTLPPSSNTQLTSIGRGQLTTPVQAFSGPGYPFVAGEAAQASTSHMMQPSGVENTGPNGPVLVQHHSQKMDMNHLLTPASEIPPVVASMSATPRPEFLSREGQPLFTRSSPQPQKPAISATPSLDYFQQQQQQQQPQLRGQSIASSPHSQSQGIRSRPSPSMKQDNLPSVQQPESSPLHQRQSLKRAAESDLTGPPQKQARTQRNTGCPTWARIANKNPRFQKLQAETNGGPNLAILARNQTPANPSANGSAYHGGQSIIQNGSIPSDVPPWLHYPPLDLDLIRARNILGPWEKTFMWNTPYPDLLRSVQDWMFVTLDGLQDVGWNAADGAVEVEAKIGTLLDRDDQRCRLPITTSTMIHPAANKNYRFESQMTESEHKAMNDFLNEAIKSTMQKGRVAMKYEHLYELDSFRHLSPSGLRAIPQALQRHQGHRDPKLRTTTVLDKAGQPRGIKARIVKMNIDSIHIFNPLYRYDCRVSVNVEVNLDQPHLDPTELVVEPTEARPTEPNRNKDRLSYKHLVYSIDLTKVTIDGMAPKHELELEVDGNALREHHRLMKAGQPNAFADILSGFLDNTTFLMRQRVGT